MKWNIIYSFIYLRGSQFYLFIIYLFVYLFIYLFTYLLLDKQGEHI